MLFHSMHVLHLRMFELLKTADKELFLFLNGMHNSFFDFIMYWASDRFLWIPFYMLLLIILIKEYKKKAIFILVLIASMITISDQVSSTIVKNYVHRLRPCHNPEIESVVHLVNGYCGGSYGYFSSHASNTSALALFLILILRRSGRKDMMITKKTMLRKTVLFSVLILFALLVSYSRIYLGSHYPFDVFTGIVFGSLLSFIFAQIFFRFGKLNTQINNE